MKLSAKSRYGLKAMYYLGKNKGKGPISLKIIAGFSGVSSPYLEKLLGVLRQKELIFSTRGATGGYEINHEPKDISVGDVIRALEGEVLYVDCVTKNCTETGCPNKSVFENLYNQINKVLDAETIQDMINKDED